MSEEKLVSEKISKLDNQAKQLGMGGNFSPENDEESYKKRMQQRKDIQLQRIKTKKTKKGLLIVFTGNGKGKTTASLGMALRTIGHGHKVAIIQFIKGGWATGEEKALKNFSTNFNFLSTDGIIGDSEVISNTTTYNFDSENSLQFRTTKDLKADFTEYYNLIYSYETDCLTASIEYNKKFYTDKSLVPEQSFLFYIRFIPFTEVRPSAYIINQGGRTD